MPSPADPAERALRTDAWRPEQYERFHDERSAPFRALLARVARRPGMRVLDLGCGTGEHTAALHAELRARATLGVDRSGAMLAKARDHRAAGLGFARADIGSFAPASPVELVFSNAALHWLPDHPALLMRLAACVAPGGELAVQVPANHGHASHAVAAQVAGEEPFRTALAGYRRRSPVLSAAEYERALGAAGFEAPCAEERVFEHLLAGPEEVVEWVKGTTLTDYEARLAPPVYARFLARYRELLLAVLPDARPFRFPFRRILFTARRP